MKLTANFSLKLLKFRRAQQMGHDAFLTTGSVIVRIPLSVVETRVENLPHVHNALRKHTVSISRKLYKRVTVKCDSSPRERPDIRGTAS
jgi:hypothetical protein